MQGDASVDDKALMKGRGGERGKGRVRTEDSNLLHHGSLVYSACIVLVGVIVHTCLGHILRLPDLHSLRAHSIMYSKLRYAQLITRCSCVIFYTCSCVTILYCGRHSTSDVVLVLHITPRYITMDGLMLCLLFAMVFRC